MAVRIIDKKGFVRVQRGDAAVERCTAAQWQETVSHLWQEMLSYHNELVSTPDFYLCKEGRILDYMGITSPEQLVTIMTSEFLGTAPEEPILLVAARN